jgi:hypothetical protein
MRCCLAILLIGATGVFAGEVTSSAADPRIEACNLRMTAPESHQWTTWWDPAGVALSGEGPSSAHSVYWANSEEKQSLRTGRNAVPLVINCSNEGPPPIAVSLVALASREKDLPLGPGTYAIVGKGGGKVRPGQMLADTLTLGKGMYDARSGTLRLEKFDMEGVSGSFVIDGIETPNGSRRIHLEGRFRIPCRGGMLETNCRANRTKARATGAGPAS